VPDAVRMCIVCREDNTASSGDSAMGSAEVSLEAFRSATANGMIG